MRQVATKVAALVLTLAAGVAVAQEQQRQQPQQPQQSAQDESEYSAEGFVQDAKAALLLQSLQGQCPNGLKRAVLIGKRRVSAYFGCWFAQGDQVRIAFEDGDQWNLPVDAFSWATEKKPTTY